MAEPSKIEVTPSGFRSWLSLGSKRASAGIRRSPDACPIAGYLVFLGVDQPCVYPSPIHYRHRLSPQNSAHWRSLPDWCNRLLRLTDRRSGPITRGCALRYLDQATAEDSS